MSWTGFSGEFDLDRVQPMLYVGPSKVVVGALEIVIPKGEDEVDTISMQGMSLTSTSSYDGKMIDISQLTTFDGVLVDGEKYGPLVIDAELKNLDALALSEFQQQIVNTYKDADNLDPDALAGNILPMYLDLFEKLLAGNPVITSYSIHYTKLYDGEDAAQYADECSHACQKRTADRGRNQHRLGDQPQQHRGSSGQNRCSPNRCRLRERNNFV